MANDVESTELVQQIVELIQRRELQAGDQLPPIRELARSFGRKVTAVRDALLHAQSLGLVKVLPRAGAFVRQTSVPSAMSFSGQFQLEPFTLLNCGDEALWFHVLDARRVIELELGRRAVERRTLEDLLPLRRTLETMNDFPNSCDRTEYVNLDIQFHLQIAQLGGNLVLSQVLRTILNQLRPHLEHLSWGEERHLSTSRMHAELYQLLVDGDANAFQAKMEHHLRFAYDALIRIVQEAPSNGDIEV